MKTLALTFIAIMLLFCKSAFAQSCTLTVSIAGLRTNKGTIYISIYNSNAGYPMEYTKALRIDHASIINNKCSFTFEGLPNGVYAIACFHDENNNGKIDTNFLGVPKEGTGASNNAKGFMGPPSFSNAKFLLAANTTEEIHMKY